MGNFNRALFSRGGARRGDRIRLRLVNAATTRMFPVSIGGGADRVVHNDGLPLAEPESLVYRRQPIGARLLLPCLGQEGGWTSMTLLTAGCAAGNKDLTTRLVMNLLTTIAK